MGTKLHCESFLTGYYSMRNLNEDSSCSSWPLSYGDKNFTNGQCYNGFTPRVITDGYPGYDKNTLRQKIIEHEAVFKNQVNELHRLYGIQRDMMEEIKRKELHKHWASVEPSSSSSRQGSQMPQDITQTCYTAGFPLLNSGYGRTSMSGVEIVNSPLSCTKGYNMHAGHSPLQNGCTSKDFEALDLRPTKMRKKLFDLQLPADEYIDTEEGEKLQDNKLSGTLSYTSNVDQKIIPERSMEIFLGASGGGKTSRQKDASGSGSCLRSPSGLADLNEPVQLDEATAPSSADLLGHTSNHGETKPISLSTKPNVGFPFLNSFRESNVNERGWLSHKYEAGPSKGNPNLVTRSLQHDKVPIPSHPAEVLLNRAHHHPGIYPTGHSVEGIWRNRLDPGLESSNRNSNYSNYSHLDPAVASHIPGPYPLIHSGFANSLSQSVPSWGKPTSSLGQKITNSSRTVQPSAQSQESFGDKWNVRSRLNPGSGSDMAICNGLYDGSVLGSKEPVHFPSSGFDFLKCGRGDNVASECSVNPGFEKFLKGASHVNLTGVTTQSSSPNEALSLKDFNMADRNSAAKDHLSAFPWLGCKPVDKKEAAKARKPELSEILGSFQASSNPLCIRSETVRDLNQVFTPNVSLASNDCEIGAKGEIGKNQNSQKILGFPIFGIHNTPIHESSSLVSTSVTLDCPSEGKNVKNEKKKLLFDINLVCESEEQIAADELLVENKLHSMGTSTRSQIDLNTCISEDEDAPAPCVASNSANVKIVMEIDLEAPVLPEMEDDVIPGKEDRQNKASLHCTENKAEQVEDEVVRNAAKTIFSISSSCQQIHNEDKISYLSEASLAESILWFADVVSSCENELKGKDVPIHDLPKEMDDFEATALQLSETKEEDYMPKPLVPEILKVEEMGTPPLPSRSRRGNARRGRQRRDFQRDILPSLASLSRHEVTEDIQIFGGLMRATGHSWNSGLIRRNGTRNGGARGRRCKLVDTTSAPVESPVCTPLMQKLNNAEPGLEDRSLTGWGKTTRRPRRQRCPAGNPPIVPLT